ncbi:hypothetical protein [Streptomyces sp. NPDC051567]|uniref:hypothetical protein n=1 Tax=Streptomyces sp. NPDC051567 TaxID=3365660 RepID=UPI00378A6AB7
MPAADPHPRIRAARRAPQCAGRAARAQGPDHPVTLVLIAAAALAAAAAWETRHRVVDLHPAPGAAPAGAAPSL